ncbi:hypothetical protein O6H91_09G094700 [Diphasiastrum complanatum]|uniref:Uncharacterized protein n=1 Tax=Diphasiastrum complanatum TaxID=34168 RepID=A0ACC2CS35_DIPCM|nr:hypothetical protein O6H91_Y526300 [Diphasiastrum complanatum]KAJ7544816.1 hypothetical protein O6H91_09G094700 [Diphasiastrum complanatum]
MATDDDAFDGSEATADGSVRVMIDFADANAASPKQQPNPEAQKMALAVVDVVELRQSLSLLGDRPDPNTVQEALQALAAIDAALANQLDSIIFAAAPSEEAADFEQWRASQANKEAEVREAAEEAKVPFQSIIELDAIHQIYEDKLREAEAALEGGSDDSPLESDAKEQADEGAMRALQEALEKSSDDLNLSGRLLPHLPELIGKLSSLKTLDLSNNSLEILPDSIAGLVNLLVLNLHANRLKALPDSIGLLPNLNVLNVSANQLRTIPESIMGCSVLKELDAGFNEIEYLAISFGLGLSNLEKLSLQLNKLTTLPPSICEVKSLKYLDLHLNKLRQLPKAIGNLINLQVLNASSNFKDLTFLPDSIGDLISLIDLDLSFNQLRDLPVSLGRLQNLKSLKLDENPLVDPPWQVIEQGHQAIMDYLLQRWRTSLMSSEASANQEENRQSWSSWMPAFTKGNNLGDWVPNVRGISEYFGNPTRKWWGSDGHQPADDYLEQQL